MTTKLPVVTDRQAFIAASISKFNSEGALILLVAAVCPDTKGLFEPSWVGACARALVEGPLAPLLRQLKQDLTEKRNVDGALRLSGIARQRALKGIISPASSPAETELCHASGERLRQLEVELRAEAEKKGLSGETDYDAAHEMECLFREKIEPALVDGSYRDQLAYIFLVFSEYFVSASSIREAFDWHQNLRLVDCSYKTFEAFCKEIGFHPARRGRPIIPKSSLAE